MLTLKEVFKEIHSHIYFPLNRLNRGLRHIMFPKSQNYVSAKLPFSLLSLQ